jgi:hypothetical protein
VCCPALEKKAKTLQIVIAMYWHRQGSVLLWSVNYDSS